MDLLTVQETARLLKVAPITVRRHIAAGRLAAVRVGRGVRIRREAIDTLLSPMTVGTGGAAEQAGANRGEGAVKVGDFVARSLTVVEQEQLINAIEQSRRFREQLRRNHGAQPVEPAWELLEEERERRTRQLS